MKCSPFFLFVLAGAGGLFPSADLSAEGTEKPFYLKENDRVVFYGDSITAQRLYSNFVETFVVTRFPKYQVTFINSGVGGDTVGGGGYGNIDQRLERDVIPYKPTVMTLMLGMNDGHYKPFDQAAYDAYTKGYDYILDTVQKSFPNIRYTLIQPSPEDDITRPPGFEGGYNATVLLRFADFVKTVAEQRHVTLANFNAPVCELLEKGKADTAAGVAPYIIPDRVHPSAGAHLIMAGALLKAWNAPGLVSQVEIDARQGKVVESKETQISDLKNAGTLSWTQMDTRLPFPVDSSDRILAFALKSSDFTETLNREPLKVDGLTADNYVLFIDGEEVGTFTRVEWENGINLATQSTPMMKQAIQVADLTNQHNAKHFHRYECNLHVPPSEDLAVLDAEEAEMVKQQRAAAQPKSRRYELKPVTAPGVGNVALNKTFISSDPNPYGWNSGLTDGSWTAGANTIFAFNSTDVFPKNVTLDLQLSQPLVKVVLGVPPFGSTKTVTVFLSEDGKTFTEVGSHIFSQKKEEKYSCEFPVQNAKYIRLSYPDHYSETVNFDPFSVLTSEVEAYGPKS